MVLVVWLQGGNHYSSVRSFQKMVTIDGHDGIVFHTWAHVMNGWSYSFDLLLSSSSTLWSTTFKITIEIYGSAHQWWMLLVWSFLIDWWTFCLKIKDLHDSHELSTYFMESDWLKVKCPDVGMKCKQSYSVKCSTNHQKCLVDHHSKQTHMGTHLVCMCNWSCDQNTLYKSWWQWCIVSIWWFISKLTSWSWSKSLNEFGSFKS